MRDYQRGWFWQLTLKMVYVTPPGQLKLDSQLWTLAGAHSRRYWDANNGLVLAAFQIATLDGEQWLVHRELKNFIEERKLLSDAIENTTTSQLSPVDEKTLGYILNIFSNAYSKYPRKTQRKHAEKTFIRVVKQHSKEQHCSLLDSAKFIAAKCAEYGDAMRIAKAEKKFIPHPATWLNRGGFLDDPSEWAVSASTNVQLSKAEQRSRRIQSNSHDFLARIGAISDDSSGSLSGGDFMRGTGIVAPRSVGKPVLSVGNKNGHLLFDSSPAKVHGT